MKTTIFVLSHDKDLLRSVPVAQHLVPVDLNSLGIGKFQSNQLSEGRAFVADLDLEEANFIGFASARWDEKFSRLVRLNDLNVLEQRNGRVWAPFLAESGWIDLSCKSHPGMEVLFQMLGRATDRTLSEMNSRPTLWCNTFICEKEVFLSLRDFVRKYIEYFYGVYGFEFPYRTYHSDPYHFTRHAGFWVERLTAWFFAMHPTLQICQIPGRTDSTGEYAPYSEELGVASILKRVSFAGYSRRLLGRFTKSFGQ